MLFRSFGGSTYGNTQVAAYLPTDPTISGIQANIGNYEVTTNANVGTIYNHVNTLDANVGAYETWANATFSTSTYGNTNVSTYLPHATGYTDAWLLPTGGNSQRPTFAANGHIRFNTDMQTPEWYDGATAAWYPFSANITYAPPSPTPYSDRKSNV